MKLEAITATREASPLEALLPRAAWDALLPPDPTPMQHFIWNEACYAGIYPGQEPRLLTVPGGTAACVVKGMIPTLFLAGAEELAEPTEPVYADGTAAELLAAQILAQNLPVRLGQPIAGTPFAEAFLRQARRKGVLVTRPTEGSPFILLDQSWTDPIGRFNARRRSDFRRMQRRAEEYGAPSFEFHQPDAREASALLEQAIEIEARSWKAEARTAVTDNPDQLAFFRHYTQLAAAEGILRIAFLRLGPELVAAQIAAECDGSFWLFKIGYDERFARCSPGQLLMLESIEQAARKGLRRFEFLGKAADWTRFWTADERPRMRLLYYPRTVSGAAALVRDSTALAIRRVKARFDRS